MSEKFKYQAIEVKQTPNARPFYLLQSNAEEILKWCDVPRKKEDFLAGYQRDLGARHSLISEYFMTEVDEGNNIIPSSIIIAARKENTKITPIAGAADGLVEIEITLSTKDFEELVKDTITELKARLNQEELASIAIENAGDDEEEDDDENEEIPPQSYIASIVKILEGAGSKLENLDDGLRETVKNYIFGISKPGLILDGQHRVYGAKNVNQFPVSLPIVLLPGLSYSEQVFHFYVLNNKAKPLNKTELRAIISTSLSNGEIDGLYDRFKQVGVTAEETEWTHKMNTDSKSPFYKLINFGRDGSKAAIPENVAFQVVSKFIKPNKKYKTIYKDIPEWSDYSFRISLFYSMWQAIKEKYPAAWVAAAERINPQILQKVSLVILQEYLFDMFANDMPRRNLRNEKSPFADPSTLKEEVSLQLTFLSEEFFTKEWKMKGLDTGAGHKAFRESLNEAINSQCQNLGNRKLFRSTT